MSIRGVTLDTGALIAIERRKQRATTLVEIARDQRALLAVPIPVVAEWWRGRTDDRERILQIASVEAVTLPVAKAAGEALAAIPRATAVDAIVMAFAASRGDVVYTSDPEDLEALQSHFPSVRVLTI
jgi:predicted nucleic acid-binding protein